MKTKISKKKRLLQTFGFVLIFLLLCGTDGCFTPGEDLENWLIKTLEMGGVVNFYNNSGDGVYAQIYSYPHCVRKWIRKDDYESIPCYVDKEYQITAEEPMGEWIQTPPPYVYCSQSIKPKGQASIIVIIGAYE